MKIFPRLEFDRQTREFVRIEELPKGELGIGFLNGFVTHIYGESGSGKTNLCLDAAKQCVGEGKKVLFIDTEGGVSAERLRQVCAQKELENILLKQPADFEEQKRIVNNLHRVLDGVGMVVIDSIISLYRLNVCSAREKNIELSRELGKMLAHLNRIARERKIAVVVSNQVYSGFDNKREILPVGGDVLLYWSKVAMEIEKEKGRQVIIRKHPFLAEGKVIKFEITNKGVAWQGSRQKSAA